MDEIISYKICAVKVRNAKLRNYLKAISTQEKFPRTRNFPKISLLNVENFQLQFSDGKFVSVNHILQNVLSAENFPQWKWAFIF
jgi:hypothetical protein